jgi:hypothetical protein
MADETRGRKGEASRLFTLALVNGVMWGLCMIGLIFVMHRSPSAKGLFVTMAVGVVVASQLMVEADKQSPESAG